MIARLSELVKNCLSKKAKGEKWLPPVMTHAKVIAHTEESNEHAEEQPKAKKEKALAFRKCLFWWGKLDSNQRSHGQQIYSLPPLAAREFPHIRLLT